MALDKSQTSWVVKAIIIFVALTFVVSMVPLFGLFGDDSTETSGEQVLGDLDAIALQYQQEQLKSHPESGTVLLSLGVLHFDWALDLMNTGIQGVDTPVWMAAADYYRRADQAGQTQPEVTTELAVCYYYAGQIDQAIEVIQQTIEDHPGFATAYFNAAIFYQSAVRDSEALSAFSRYMELDPDGVYGDTAYAQAQIDVLEAAGSLDVP